MKFRRKLRICCRLLLIQTAFTNRLMQNRGLLYALLPATDELSEGETTAFMTGQNRFFNSHPWMTGWAAGLQLYGLEKGKDTTDLKESLITPLGAIGDRLIWHHLKPVTALPAAVGIVGGLCGFPFTVTIGLLVSLLSFTLPGLFLRWQGLNCSISEGRECLNKLLALRQTAVVPHLQAWGALLLGIWLAWTAAWQQDQDFHRLFLLAGSALFYALLSRFRMRLLPRLTLALIVAGLFIALYPGL